MEHLDNIINLAKNYTATEIKEDFDLYRMLGKDFDEFMQQYARQFNVSLRNYRRYFHTYAVENGFWNVLFYSSSYDRIPITPALLATFVAKGEWDLLYPPYTCSG
ncbi:MAG TPA: DUF1493 family protein [Chitinophagaceae bacterium]|nr:DUF1493 family protein [Chitinophagaceae bacterium]